MSLIEALHNKTPLVWVDVDEPERLIAQLPTLCEGRNLYVYDTLSGLMEWSYEHREWKIVLVSVMNDEGEMVDTTITHPMLAWEHVFKQKNATFILRNAHKELEKDAGMLNMLASLYGHYRHAFWDDDDDKIPLQIISLVVDTPCPPELIAMSTVVKYSRPNRAEFNTLIQHLRSHHPGYPAQDILADQDLSKILDACQGMTEFEAMEVMMRTVKKDGVLDAEVLTHLKFERMKSMTDLEITRPKISLDDVGGLDNAKKMIMAAKWMWENPEETKRLKLKPLRRILLLGIAGCGKSLICKAAASSLDVDLAKAGVGRAMNKFVGESENNMRRMFAQVNALAPIAMWIDELGRDLSGGESSGYTDGGTTSRVHGTFLTEMQELEDDVFLFAAANNIAALPPEMLRSGRFDKILFVGFPSLTERKDIFRLHLEMEVGDDAFDLDQLANMSACFTGAEIESLIHRTRFDVSVGTGREISTMDLLATIPREKNRMWIRHKQLCMQMYAHALNDYEWASDEQREEAGDVVRGVEPRNLNKKSGVLK